MASQDPEFSSRMATREQRAAQRNALNIKGRLAYGGLTPGLVACEILDLSDTGLRVSTFSQLDPCPDLFSVEFLGLYNRARRAWSDGNQIGLEFIFEQN